MGAVAVRRRAPRQAHCAARCGRGHRAERAGRVARLRAVAWAFGRRVRAPASRIARSRGSSSAATAASGIPGLHRRRRPAAPRAASAHEVGRVAAEPRVALLQRVKAHEQRRARRRQLRNQLAEHAGSDTGRLQADRGPPLTAASAGRAATAGRSSTVLRMVAAGTVMRGVIWLLIGRLLCSGDLHPARNEPTKRNPCAKQGNPDTLEPRPRRLRHPIVSEVSSRFRPRVSPSRGL